MSYSYSPIKKLYVKNFRNIGEAIIDFSDSPIVSLIGENEAGKTSIVKAFSVCALHSSPRDQKDYIRDGTDGFGVAIELEDGTIVTRIKRPNLNWYSVKTLDGKEWNTSKIDSGLPVEVQKVMGLIEEPETKEFLQIRTYEDQLLFVVTPASTNYKVMYDALKVDQLTRAIKLGSKEVNSLKAEIDHNDSGIATLTANLRQIRTIDIQPLLSIKQRLNAEIHTIDKLNSIVRLLDNIELKKKQIGTMEAIVNGKVAEISEYKVNTISSIARLIDHTDAIKLKLDARDEVDNLVELDISSLIKLNSASDKLGRILSIKASLGTMVDIGSINEQSISEIALIHTIINTLNNIESLSRATNIVNVAKAEFIEQADIDIYVKSAQAYQKVLRQSQVRDAISQIDTYCKQVEDYIKSLGAAVEICPNCGESIVIDTEKFM